MKNAGTLISIILIIVNQRTQAMPVNITAIVTAHLQNPCGFTDIPQTWDEDVEHEEIVFYHENIITLLSQLQIKVKNFKELFINETSLHPEISMEYIQLPLLANHLNELPTENITSMDISLNITFQNVQVFYFFLHEVYLDQLNREHILLPITNGLMELLTTELQDLHCEIFSAYQQLKNESLNHLQISTHFPSVENDFSINSRDYVVLRDLLLFLNNSFQLFIKLKNRTAEAAILI